jgi:hypothetical protein
MDPKSLLAACHQAVLAEVGQVARDGRLWQLQGLVEMADTDLFSIAAEEVQEPQAYRVRERLEQAGRSFQGVGRS